MADRIAIVAVWFEKSLQIGRLKPGEAASPKALREALACYLTGLVFSRAVFVLVYFASTGQKFEIGDAIGIPLALLVQLVDAALFVLLLHLCLLLVGRRLRLRHVATVCCYALGGQLPFIAVFTAYFRYSAIQLALNRQDPSLPYLGAAITSALEQRQDSSIRILVLVCLCLAVATILFYSAHIVRLLSGLGAAKSTARTWMAYIAGFCVNGLAMIYYFNPAMWLLIIRLGGSRGSTQ
ncbi:MAG: hypothetical protein ABSA41_18845 [Terriglobia bacterium]|jgi:hypothetical protein